MEKQEKKPFLKRSWKKLVGLVMVIGLSLGLLSGCSLFNKITNPDETNTNIDNPGVDDPGTDNPGTDDPVVDDPSDNPPTNDDILEFEKALEDKFGDLVDYTFKDQKLYLYANKQGNTNLYGIGVSGQAGFETVKKLEQLTKEIKVSKNKPLASFESEKSYIEYDGMKYNLNGIKGPNIFAERVGSAVSSKDVTSVSVDLDSASMIIEIAKSNSTIISKVETENQVDSEEDLLNNLLNAENSSLAKEIIPFGIDTKQLTSETAVEVIPPVEEERAPTTEELVNFGVLVDNLKSGNMLDFDIINDCLYLVEETSSGLEMYFYNLQEGEGLETNKTLEALSTSLQNNGLMKDNDFKVLNTASEIEYEGFTYSTNSIGENLIYPQATENTKTSIAEITKIIDDGSSTGYSAVGKVVVGEDNQTKFYTVKAEVNEIADMTEMITALRNATGETEVILSSSDALSNSIIEFTAPKQIEDPTIDPDDPIDTPNEDLDFTALETKLEEVILAKHRGVTLNEIISYSAENGKMYLVYDTQGSAGSTIRAYELTLNVEDLSTQENIDLVTSSISKDSYNGSALVSLGKASSDITVKGTTYSKDGIEGDNAFARQCGIDNALMTYVSDMGPSIYGDFDGYCRVFDIMVVYEENQETKIMLTSYQVADTGTYWENFFITGSYKEISDKKNEFILGTNLKQEETTASNAYARLRNLAPIYFFNNDERLK